MSVEIYVTLVTLLGLSTSVTQNLKLNFIKYEEPTLIIPGYKHLSSIQLVYNRIIRTGHHKFFEFEVHVDFVYILVCDVRIANTTYNGYAFSYTYA